MVRCSMEDFYVGGYWCGGFENCFEELVVVLFCVVGVGWVWIVMDGEDFVERF